MESEQMCKNHPKQSLSWICLERNCQQRVMCSTCAVKLHDRNHKVEELYHIYENGCLATYFSNKKNSTAGLLQLVNGEQSNTFENEQYDDYLQEGIERCLRNVSKKIEETKAQLIQQHEQWREGKENERINFIAQLSDVDAQLKASQNLEADIENAFQQIELFAQKRELEMANNKESAILLKKIRLLELMKDNFLKMIKSYFHNQFTAEFCHLFDMQIETLNAREVDDVQGFLEYVDSKWKQDYRNIQLSIEKFVSRLNEGLKYCIGMPLENQKKQLVVRSPMRQFPMNIQSQTYLQFTSPKQLEFTKSQVIYEEPSQRKNIKIEPVSQSLQQYQ
ncbi:unnamed protein product (macronuclear) [Paramecium tetraurelia]|uniref:B box-type domain-containing protein n=1 Tax=Paramecium tetraurelia TaxID=5888 RepID=A0BME8_PARTE|nr:uncharacterized protein GSPATT00030351001 [Paramecium tetraurelia]CAK59715.1 unnamed protein product [Paramecium tetraurelia]|eukprot:XP_001427113.1 hypothetical protein (macronuclear) [Paramecium tetraurelia strain d4-2]